jgi:ligand-binding SRPBCC domain-containing protein
MDHSNCIKMHNKNILPISLDEAWEFFSTPKSLAVLTPAAYQFKIIGALENKMYVNQKITYQLKMYGLPMNWVSEIVEYEEGKIFTDKMSKGPYKTWYHEHKFTKIDVGVLVEDIINYEVGFGFLGGFIDKVFVSKQLKSLFDYRNEILRVKFVKGV